MELFDEFREKPWLAGVVVGVGAGLVVLIMRTLQPKQKQAGVAVVATEGLGPAELDYLSQISQDIANAEQYQQQWGTRLSNQITGLGTTLGGQISGVSGQVSALQSDVDKQIHAVEDLINQTSGQTQADLMQQLDILKALRDKLNSLSIPPSQTIIQQITQPAPAPAPSLPALSGELAQFGQPGFPPAPTFHDINTGIPVIPGPVGTQGWMPAPGYPGYGSATVSPFNVGTTFGGAPVSPQQAWSTLSAPPPWTLPQT